MSLQTWLVIAMGGELGAVSRYAVSLGMQDHWVNGFPWSTLIVNVLGCLLIGIVFQFSQGRDLRL